MEARLACMLAAVIVGAEKGTFYTKEGLFLRMAQCTGRQNPFTKESEFNQALETLVEEGKLRLVGDEIKKGPLDPTMGLQASLVQAYRPTFEQSFVS